MLADHRILASLCTPYRADKDPGLARHDRRSVARNVMLFIADGASWGTWHMASYYEHGALGRQPYDRFSVKLGMTTEPLNTASRPQHDATSRCTATTASGPGTPRRSPAPGSAPAAVRRLRLPAPRRHGFRGRRHRDVQWREDLQQRHQPRQPGPAAALRDAARQGAGQGHGCADQRALQPRHAGHLRGAAGQPQRLCRDQRTDAAQPGGGPDHGRRPPAVRRQRAPAHEPLLGLVQVHDTLQANRSAAVVGDDTAGQPSGGVARIRHGPAARPRWPP
jgi:hypothetical protein